MVMCLLSCAPARAQTLVYSLSYSETMASSRARFANMSPNPGLRSEAENIATLRNTRKNEIYSISVADGKRIGRGQSVYNRRLARAAHDSNSGLLFR
jgi:hypothetical protein